MSENKTLVSKDNMKAAWKSSFTISVQELVTMAMLIALEIVLNRFGSINMWNLKIGFAFVPVVVAGMLLGPFKAGVVGAVADLIGALLFPIGAYFPGFTATAFLRGILYGTLLYKRVTPFLAGLTTLIDQLVCALLINSFWISVLYGAPFGGTVVSRLVQIAILIPVEFIVILVLPKLTEKLRPYMNTKKRTSNSF